MTATASNSRIHGSPREGERERGGGGRRRKKKKKKRRLRKRKEKEKSRVQGDTTLGMQAQHENSIAFISSEEFNLSPLSLFAINCRHRACFDVCFCRRCLNLFSPEVRRTNVINYSMRSRCQMRNQLCQINRVI